MKNIAKLVTLVMALLMVFGTLSVAAITPYSTYTYDIDGMYAASPDAYTPDQIVDSAAMGLDEAKPMDSPRDLFVDDKDNVYIADATNNRIIVCNRNLQYKFEISEFTNDQGVPDSLLNCQGVFVTDEYIYVADTDNNRIVLFDLEGEYVSTVEEPRSDVFPENSIYKPVALAVDAAGRMYIVSSTTYMGVISIGPDGEFTGFIGAQQVNISALEILWRKIQTKEQRETSTQYVSTEFNNITIDKDGFIYVTTSSIDESAQQAAIRSKDAGNAPVKKLNTAGSDILKRNGFFAPGGEVSVMNAGASDNDISGASKIIDVALGPQGTWSIIDEKRQKIYTYDEEGSLLFIFGDSGMQTGNLSSIQAIAYKGTDILVLDKTANNITVYKRTEYGNLLLTAIQHNRERQYDLALDDWTNVLQRNSNFDEAYIGIGQALYREGQYEEAMEYFKSAYDTTNYSDAFAMWRQDWVKQYVWVVILVVVVVIVAYSMFFKYAGKVNIKGHTKVGKRTFWEEILYGFWIIFHPFDGFWDLKHEKRGSVRGAFFWIGATILAFTYKSVGSSYLVNPYNSYLNIIATLTSVMVPFLLWAAANWCLTTLFDGEGSFKDIFIATGYALVPIPLFMFPVTICTHFLTLNEVSILNLLLTFSFVWVGLLIVFGTQVTHDYSFGKNIIMCVCTIVGMAFIMFIAILFSGLANNIVSFVSAIVVEISYRL
ncbi:MAG: YIP1 family protein [Clostridia bacterium]|nr:YIP1 family protein [Clostridia bacterium]